MTFVELRRLGEEGSIAEIILNRPEARNAFNGGEDCSKCTAGCPEL